MMLDELVFDIIGGNVDIARYKNFTVFRLLQDPTNVRYTIQAVHSLGQTFYGLEPLAAQAVLFELAEHERSPNKSVPTPGTRVSQAEPETI